MLERLQGIFVHRVPFSKLSFCLSCYESLDVSLFDIIRNSGRVDGHSRWPPSQFMVTLSIHAFLEVYPCIGQVPFKKSFLVEAVNHWTTEKLEVSVELMCWRLAIREFSSSSRRLIERKPAQYGIICAWNNRCCRSMGCYWITFFSVFDQMGQVR